jgi:hypothetical protein
MGLDSIRKMGLIYRSRKYVFEFEDKYQSKYDYQIASLIATFSFQQEVAINLSGNKN